MGHPDAKPYRAGAWLSQRKAVEALFQANADHQGLREVTQLVAELMQKAAVTEGAFKGARELRRLIKHGVTASRIVLEFTAVSVWLHDNRNALPSDKARDFCISRAIFGLAPRDRRPCGTGASSNWRAPTDSRRSYSPKARASALDFVGRYLRQSLSAFTSNVILQVEADRARLADPIAHQRAPLRSPSVASSLPF